MKRKFWRLKRRRDHLDRLYRQGKKRSGQAPELDADKLIAEAEEKRRKDK